MKQLLENWKRFQLNEIIQGGVYDKSKKENYNEAPLPVFQQNSQKNGQMIPQGNSTRTISIYSSKMIPNNRN